MSTPSAISSTTATPTSWSGWRCSASGRPPASPRCRVDRDHDAVDDARVRPDDHRRPRAGRDCRRRPRPV